MGLWNAPLDLKSANFLVHFGNHFVDHATILALSNNSLSLLKLRQICVLVNISKFTLKENNNKKRISEYFIFVIFQHITAI